MSKPRVGILALQGNFEMHRKALEPLGAFCVLVKHAHHLAGLDALIVPGGESTTFLKLLLPEMISELRDFASSGRPMLCTCAGLIVFAREVSNPQQSSLGILDIEVSRNAYGRQIDSFSDRLILTRVGKLAFGSDSDKQLEGVFIRAPQITSYGSEVEVLAEHNSKPVLIRQGNIIGSSFHPELSEKASLVHKLLLASIG